MQASGSLGEFLVVISEILQITLQLATLRHAVEAREYPASEHTADLRLHLA